MIVLGYDAVEASADGNRLRVRPNCPVPVGRFHVTTLSELSLMPGLGFAATDVLVRERRPFVYPLELTWAWSQMLTTGPEAMAPDIPAGVLDAIRAERASLLFFEIEPIPLSPNEYSALFLFDHIQRFIQAFDLPARRVWLVSGFVRALETFAYWLQLRGLYHPEVFHLRAMQPCVSIVRALYRANQQGWDVGATFESDYTVNLTRGSFSADAFAARYVQVESVLAERESGTLRPKRFLAMNRHRWPHRMQVTSYLAGRGYLDDSLVSFSAGAAEDFDLEPPPVLEEFLRASWLKLQPRLPLTIDAGPPNNHGFNPNHLSKMLSAWPYQQSYFNITNETSMRPPPFHTEKVMKPILNMQPFIMAGPPDTLRYMHAIGFRTFARVLDESYDAPAEPATRLTRLFQSIDAVGQLNQSAARDLYFECLPEIQHNRAHLIEGPHQLEMLWGEIEAQLP